MLEEQIRALGALPQQMAFSEVYQALQTGVVDGTENPISEPLHAEDARGAEASDHHGPWLSRLCGDQNKKFWDGLPAMSGQLEDAMKATRYANQIAQVENDKSLEASRRAARRLSYVPTKEERPSRRHWLPVHQKMETHRQGDDPVGLQGNGLRSRPSCLFERRPGISARPAAGSAVFQG